MQSLAKERTFYGTIRYKTNDRHEWNGPLASALIEIGSDHRLADPETLEQMLGGANGIE